MAFIYTTKVLLTPVIKNDIYHDFVRIIHNYDINALVFGIIFMNRIKNSFFSK